MLVDTHCHLFSEYYDNIDEVLNRASESGVKAVIVNGTNSYDNREVVELVSKYDMVYVALGLLPQEIGDDWEEEDVKRVYGDYTFEDALTDRMNDIHMYADIVGKVINR